MFLFLASLIALTNGFGSVTVDTFGARVLSYVPTGGREIFADLSPGFGGVPLCWPWYKFNGPKGQSSPKHGLARYETFELVSRREASEESELVLRLESNDRTKREFPHDFSLELRVVLSRTLTLELAAKNTGGDAFKVTEAFHPYLLRDELYRSKLDGTGDWVVWNPDEGSHRRTVGIGPDDWQKFLCVENGTFSADLAYELAPGETHVLRRVFNSAPVRSVTILDQPGWCNWCPSPAYLPDGRVALAFSRWPTKDGFEAWCAKSEIALAISKTGPLGPYEFVKTILPGSGRTGDFDRDVTHNPFLFVDGGKYYVYYMGTWSDTGNGHSGTVEKGSFRMNQRIGVAWADSIEGPYHRSGRQLFADDAIPEMNMNSNPTVIRRPDGRYLMVFKWGENPALPWPRCFVHMASAVADTPLGPWKVVNRDVFPVRYVNFAGEDPYLWLEGRTICCAIHDMGRFYAWDDRALIKFESSDGVDWQNCGVLLSRGTVSRLERPAILCGADGSRLLFAASKPSSKEPNSLIVAYPGAIPEPMRQKKGN